MAGADETRSPATPAQDSEVTTKVAGLPFARDDPPPDSRDSTFCVPGLPRPDSRTT